jgi:hypothetical protein
MPLFSNQCPDPDLHTRAHFFFTQSHKMMWSWNCSIDELIMGIFAAKRQRILIPAMVLAFSLCVLSTEVEAQSNAKQRANALREQLAETQAKQQSLETRLGQLEEELKSENIEKSLAGIGSTRPEDLREFRRRQLEIEKLNIQTQLKVLAEGKTRTEAGILQADADVYHQSAAVNSERRQQSSVEQQPARAGVRVRARRTKNKQKRQRIHRLIQN